MKKLLALEKTLRELEKMNLYKPFPTDVKSATWDESNEFILNDKCLFYFNASWMYNIWQKKNDAKLKNSIEPVEPPSFKPNIAAIGGYLCDWVVLKNSPNRDRAVKFLTEMSNPEVAEKWARYTKSPTGLKENLSGSSFGKDQFETYSREIYKKYGKAILDNNKTGYYLLGQKGQNCYLYLPDVIFGKIKAEEAISRIRANLRGLKLM